MKIALTVLFCFCVSCFVGSCAPPSKMKIPDEGADDVRNRDDKITKDFVKTAAQVKQYETSLDLTKSKINESEIFENGHTAKKDHERSFIYIKNIKSRLPWSMSRVSLFQDDFGNSKDVPDDAYDKIKSFNLKSHSVANNFYFNNVQSKQNSSYSDKHNRNDDNSENTPLLFSTNGRDPVGVKKLPHIAFRKTTLPPTPVANVVKYGFTNIPQVPIKPFYNNEAFNGPVNTMVQKGKFANDQNSYKNPPLTMPGATVLAPYNTDNPNRIYLPHSDQHSKNDKLDKYINSVLGDENQFDCYNRDCTDRSKNYRVNMNNGVRLGSQCVCLSSPYYTPVRTDWQPWKKSATATDKAFIRAVKAKKANHYAALIKETKKLSQAVDRMV